MYERMLDKQTVPTLEDLTTYCGNTQVFFTQLNAWLATQAETTQDIVFPYGNTYGWGIAHKKKKKLICNIFAENQAFTVMLRLSNEQFNSIYQELDAYTQHIIDHKYPCGNGGWIHYRVTCLKHLEDIKKLLTIKCI